MKQKKINVVKSPTGSGKTYAMLHASIKDAQRGDKPILLFPNINLLDENKKALQSILKEKQLDSSIFVYTVVQTENYQYPDFLELFEKTSIILTLHVYFVQRGEFFTYSAFYYAASLFARNIVLYVDECHLFFNNFEKNIPITRILGKEKNQWRILSSGPELEELIKNSGKENVKMSKPYLSSKKISVAGQGYADFGYTLDDYFGFFDNDMKGLQTIPSEIYSKLQKDVDAVSEEAVASTNTEVVVPPTTNTEVVIPPTTNTEVVVASNSEEKIYDSVDFQTFIPTIKNGKFSIVGNRKHSFPFFTLVEISLSENLATITEIKEKVSLLLMKIISYNSLILFFQNAIDPKKFKTFKSKIKTFISDGSSKNQIKNEIEKFLIQELTNYTQKLETDKDHFNKDSYENQKPIDEFKNNLSEMSNDFIEICEDLLKKNPDKIFNIITIENENEAFSIFALLCEHIYLSFNYAKEKNDKIIIWEKSFENFTEKIFNIHQKGKKAKTSQEGEESTLEEEDFVGKLIYDYSSLTPFTFSMYGFNLWDLSILEKFKKGFFLSATHSHIYLDQIWSKFPDANFVEFETGQAKLNRLILVESKNDLFSSKEEPWRKNWYNFAEFFYNTFVESQDPQHQKFCLFLLDSNNSASKWVNTGIDKNSQAFTLVAGSKETSQVELKFQVDFTQSAKNIAKFTTIKVSSILSTVSCGLNMPQHPFMIISAASYKPVQTLWLFGDANPRSANYYTNLNAQIQALGRFSRRTDFEKQNPQVFTGRVAILSKAKTFAGNGEMLTALLLNQYETVTLLDLSYFDLLIGRQFMVGKRKVSRQITKKNTGNFIDNFNALNPENKLKITDLFPNGLNFKEDIRFEFFKKLTNCLTDSSYDISKELGKYENFLESVRYYSRILHACRELSVSYFEFLKDTNSENLNTETLEQNFYNKDLLRNMKRSVHLYGFKKSSDLPSEDSPSEDLEGLKDINQIYQPKFATQIEKLKELQLKADIVAQEEIVQIEHDFKTNYVNLKRSSTLKAKIEEASKTDLSAVSLTLIEQEIFNEISNSHLKNL